MAKKKTATCEVGPSNPVPPMTILGIDAGFSAPGFCVIERVENSWEYIHGSCVITKCGSGYKSHDDARRISLIADHIKDLVESYKPDIAAVELPSAGAKNSSALRGMAYATASTSASLHCCSVRMFPVTPRGSKVFMTKDPNAEKCSMIKATMSAVRGFVPPSRLKRKIMVLDEVRAAAIADAISAAITVFYTTSWKKIAA